MNNKIARRRLLAGLVAFGVFGALVVTTLRPAPESPPTSSPISTAAVSPATNPTPVAPAPTPLAGAKVALRACDESSDVAPAPAAAVDPPVSGPVSLEVVGQLGGASPGIALDGRRLLTGQGQRVGAFDLSDPARPTPSGASDTLPGTVSALAASDTLVVAGLGMAGIAVLDRAELELLGTVALPGWVEAVAIHGDLAFIADGPGGLRVIDLSTPATPRDIGVALDLHRVMDVVVANSVAYIAAADEGFVTIDVSDPGTPMRVGGLVTGGYAYGLDVDSGIAYLADAWGGLVAIDVAKAAAPRTLATVPSLAWITGVDVVDGRVFASAGPDGLLAFEITPSGTLESIGSLPMPTAPAESVVVGETGAIVTTSSQGAAIVDVEDPAQPLVIGRVTPFGSAQGMALVGDRAYMAARDQGLRIVDVADPVEPREVGQVLTLDQVTAVASTGENAFFWTVPAPDSGASHSIFGLPVGMADDLKPATPFQVGNTVGATVSGSLILLGNESGVQIIDGSSATPCQLGFLQTLEEGRALAGGVATNGDVAYVTVGETGLYVVDIADPRRPVRIAAVPLPDRGKSTNAVLAAGSTLYTLSNGHDGEIVATYDVSRPSRPRPLGTLTLPDPSLALTEDGVQPLAYEDGRLFVADGPGGLVIVDVSRPVKPRVAGRLRLPGKAASVVVRDGLAYVAVLGQGLSIVRWSEGVAAAGAVGPGNGLGSRIGGGSSVGNSVVLAMQGDPGHCVVTATRDAGAGSLRACLDGAAPGLEITFDPATFPRRNPREIRIRSPLPPLEGIKIDASRAGVVLDGGHEVEEGLHLGSTSEVRGLTVSGFVVAGIFIDGSTNLIAGNVVGGNEHAGVIVFGGDNHIVGNLIGPDPTGRRGWERQELGLDIHDVANVVGGTTAGDRNVIAGNFLEVSLKQASGNTIEGNYIGIDASGRRLMRPSEQRAQFGAIVFDFNAGGNVIRGNVIGGEVSISGADLGTSHNQIVGNLVGVDATGTHGLPCECHGIAVGSPFTRVGGTSAGEGNVVNGGIEVSGHDVIVLGNRLGVGVDDRSLGKPGGGPLLFQGAQRSVAGGASEGAGNRVVGPVAVRVAGGATSNLVLGNTLQPWAFFEEDEAAGMIVVAATANLLVGNRVESGKVGVLLGAGADGNVFRGNTLAKNDVGLRVVASTNLIVLNTFSANRLQAIDRGTANRWDDGSTGNYWSDHTGTDASGDGIVDAGRRIPPNGRDQFPLAAPP